MADGDVRHAQNMVLGLYSKMTIYPEIIIRLGGGYVQQKTDWWARGEVWWLISRFFMIETIGDDPRGYYFVTVGREHYEKWLENGSLPEAPKIRR